MANLIHSVLSVLPREIATVHPTASVKECIDLMAALDIGALVVQDDEGQLVGIVSERDIIRSCLNKHINPFTAQASDIAFTAVSILSPHDLVERAMQVMTATKRRHVLIQDKNTLIAILSIGDLMYHLLDDKARVIEQLEHYIHA